MTTRTASAPRAAGVPAYQYCSTLRIRPAAPTGGFVDFTLGVVADDRLADVPALLQGGLHDLGNGSRLLFGRAEAFMLGELFPVERCKRLAVAAMAAGKVFRPAGKTPSEAERTTDVYVEGAA